MGLGKRLSDFFNRSGAKKQPSPAEVTAFIAAAAEGNEKAVKKFCKNYPAHVDTANKDGQTALGAVARNNRITVGEILLDAKADPNKPGLFGESPLHLCVAFSFYNPDDFRLLDRMLKSGGNVNFQQKAWAAGGFSQAETLVTPLMSAAALQNEKLCDYLFKNGANPLLKNIDGKTARDCVPAILQDIHGLAADETTARITAKLEKAEEEWAARPTSEWRGKVTPSNWQGH
jgi:ankyrin repeat protein